MSVESCREGPSRPKGKGRDSCEWGNIQLSEAKADAVLQQVAYESYKEHRQQNKRQRKFQHGNC
jgi:hypothetical protein